MNTPANGRAAGGLARAAKMSEKQRSAASKRAAKARWSPVPEAICGSADAPLVIGNANIECYVLEDGTRVITQGSFLRALGRARTVRRVDEEGMPPILQGKAIRSYVDDDLAKRAAAIPFRLPSGTRAHGYNAELLPDVCEVFLAARRDGTLPQNQQHVAMQAELLVRGLARVGIIALVDEATGYQDIRAADALAKVLEEFVDREIQAYLTTFPPEFYKQLFRLRGLPYSPETVGSARPQYFGKLTNNIVYARLAPGVLEELKKVQEKTDSGHAKHKMFQKLTANVGYPKLREHLGSVVTLMKLSTDYDDFMAKLDLLHPRWDRDTPLDLDVTPRRP